MSEFAIPKLKHRQLKIEKKFKFRYTLYAPDSLTSKSIEGFNSFDLGFKVDEFASVEMARKVGQFRKWYQIVDNYSNKVIEEKQKEDLDWES